MLRHCLRRLFAPLVRQVDHRGFAGDFRQLTHIDASDTQARVKAILQLQSNVLLCGHYGTGKMTTLRALGVHCESRLGLRVAYISADGFRVSRLDGYLLYNFLGLRSGKDELPSQEQLEGTMERHIRLVNSTYDGAFPSLRSVDVLILDALEKVPPTVLLSMDAVSRRAHGEPGKPFGGIRVFAAADFWALPVHPTSDTGGYIFQLPNWREIFPHQQLLRDGLRQSTELRALVHKAYFGMLSDTDVRRLESRVKRGESSSSPSPRQHTRGGATRQGSSGNNSSSDWGGRVHYDEMMSSADVMIRFSPRFPKQPAIILRPPRLRQLKQTEIGSYLCDVLTQSCTPMSFGLVGALNLDVGSQVHLLYQGTQDYGVPAGAVGEVRSVREHSITVHFPVHQRTVDIHRMRVTCYHACYPEITTEIRQFPLYPRECLSPLKMLSYMHAYYIKMDGRCMVDTNDLGNLLARMRGLDDFTLTNTTDHIHLEGIIHEPTRIYYHDLMQAPLSEAKECWCRNCKTFVATDKFMEHWSQCIQSVRWCAECDKVIPLELLGPHREKHQVVLCLDCGQPVEWRQWEAHRLSCGAMMREVSPDNEFLPLRTRQLALELGLDKRDLHTMQKFSKSSLPKPSR